MIRRWGIFLSLISVFALGFSNTTFAAKEKAEWTFLIFLNADNNLELAGYDDIWEMEKLGSSSAVNVVVQYDGLNPQGTQRIYIKKAPDGYEYPSEKSFYSPVVEDMPEQDMGSTDTLIDFVTWGMENYPADKYFVIIWNHGSGWSKETDVTLKSISYDDTSGTHIRTNELSDAFEQIVSRAGRRIDVLGFDACLMGMFEVAESLVGKVDYLIASEETEPWDGYAYDDLLRAFYKRANKGTEGLVHDAVHEYGKSYTLGSQGYKSVTQSGIKLSKIAAVKTKLNAWLEIVESRTDISSEDLLGAAKDTIYYYDSYYRDLGDYVQKVLGIVSQEDTRGIQLSSSVGLVGASLELLKAINEAVIENFNSSRYAASTGIAIYLPYTGGWWNPWSQNSVRKTNYLELQWAETTDWPAHLDYLFPPPEGASFLN